MNDSSCTHRTRLDRYIQIAILETVVAEILACISERENLRMCGWIVGGNGLVSSPANDLTITYHNGPNRNLSGGLRTLTFS